MDINITSCPLDYIPAVVWETFELAELFEKGLPPIAGGVLDQAENFLAACRQIETEMSHWQRKRT